MNWFDFQLRKWRSFLLMRAIYNRTQKVADECEALGEEDAAECAAKWDECHQSNAMEIRMHAEEQKGLLIKACQFMSSLGGIIPDPYCEEFMKLTDDLPVSSMAEVYHVIERDLGRHPDSIFDHFEPTPIASASIAQVHRAALKGEMYGQTGPTVAVKVQHEGVDSVFLHDVETLSSIAEQVVFWLPSLDFRKHCQEWQESLPRELDFTHEVRALERARDVLLKHNIKVRLPKPLKKFSGTHVLVMEFIEAEPIMMLANADFCRAHKLDKHAILETLLNAFGVMIFKDGLFHADPHVGNVRILLDKTAPGGAVPVLFDWGFHRELTEQERLGMAKVFYAVANFDMAGLFEVLGDLGYRFKEGLAADDSFRRELLEKVRGLMKDTVSKQQTRQNIKLELEEALARLEREGQKSQLGLAQYSPMNFLEEWPRCIVFFLRMLQILRGLCVSVEAAGMPVLNIFGQHAREALVEESKKPADRTPNGDMRPASSDFVAATAPLTAVAGPPPPERLPPAVSSSRAAGDADGALEARVRARLLALNRRFVGVQVAVVRDGRLVCDVAAGTLSAIDCRPVVESTRFPLMGAIIGIASLALTRSMRRLHGGDLTTKVVDLWPDFSRGESSVTLADLLSHAAGVQDAFPTDFGPSWLDDVSRVLQHFARVELPQAREPRYAHLLQPFLLAKLGCCLQGGAYATLPEHLGPAFAQWLNVELGDCGFDVRPSGGGGSATEAAVCRDIPQLSRVSMSEVERAKERRRSSQAADAALRLAGLAGGDNAPAKETATLIEAVGHDPLAFDPLLANTGGRANFRGGLSLGASARGLARLLAADALWAELCDTPGALEPPLKAPGASAGDPTALGWALTGGACQWTAAGLQVFKLRARGRCGCRRLCQSRQQGYGVSCGLGPCVVHFPGIAGGLTIAVTANDVLHRGEVVDTIFSEILAPYGYVPVWPKRPRRVTRDAAKLAVAAAPLLRWLGDLRSLAELNGSPAGRLPSTEKRRSSWLRRLACCCCCCCCWA